MEKNKPISVAFEDIRNNPDFIEHSEYRFINDDLGMVISFQAMGFRLFRTQQPYRAKEGRIVRIMQGKVSCPRKTLQIILLCPILA